MNRIQIILFASLALCLNTLSFAQTTARQNTSTPAPTLQAYNHTPGFESKDGSPAPQTPAYCWSTTTLLTSAAPALLFNDVVFTANVNMSSFCRGTFGSCGGQVTFYDFNTVIGTATVSRSCVAMIDTSSLTAGRHRITAYFQPGGFYQPSSAHLRQDVDKWPSPITLSSSADTSSYGQDVTFTVTVSSDIEEPPTGKVRFSDGTKAFGLATLDENGVATFTKKNLAVGTHSITAEYYGDSISAKSTSAVLTLVVN